MSVEPHLQEIKATVGEQAWLETGDELSPYLTEWRGRFSSRARAVVFPASTDEVARVVAICNRARIGIVPQGGNTGLCGGAVGLGESDQIILNLRRLGRILEIDAPNYTITVQAGAVLAHIQAAAREVDRLFPLSLGAQGSCQIGGNLSTNAGGINVLRYGNARDLCLGLEVVLPNGQVWSGLKGLRKDNTGYSLRDLFVGAEGTLGIITAAVLKLFPLPKAQHTALVALTDLPSSTALLARARQASDDKLSSFELMSRTGIHFAVKHVPGCRDPFELSPEWYVLLVFSSGAGDHRLGGNLENLLQVALEDGLIRDAAIASSDAQAQAFWRLREGLVEAQRQEGASIKHDVSVPVSRVPAFVEAAGAAVAASVPGIRPCVFGHLGDGNVHYNLSRPESMKDSEFFALQPKLSKLVYDTVDEHDGSFSAEHGIGLLRIADMSRYKDEVELKLMGQIKTALDPNGIMNPGKVLPD